MFVNEFVGYLQLITMMENGAEFRSHVAANGTYMYDGRDVILLETNTTLVGGVMNVTFSHIQTN